MAVAPEQHVFASRAALANELARVVADALQQAVDRRGAGFLAVSGGNTPAQFFAALSQADIDWAKIVVTLVDERLVPPSSLRSNARLATERLLQGPAGAARFAPLYHGVDDAEAAAELAKSALAPLPWPLDVVVLGMGADGHTASFFPDATDLAALTDPAAPEMVMPVHAASAGEARLTLTMAPIMSAGLVALHIEGADKQATLERALGPGERLPIRAVFDSVSRPVQIFWAG